MRNQPGEFAAWHARVAQLQLLTPDENAQKNRQFQRA
ncbi:hypothetical protein EDD41_2731 [Luteococcus japonicus]|uniref:Uncharacterized protein n=1 Tax=Luteococcus japonicus TaxID=33984 RepID=A0A3N1ZYA8_9ACTN|nr:hypothetical protein EDD41_2731 [Luteococcus japonicus]